MEGVGNIARHPPVPGRGGAKLVLSHRPALARDRVMHIGEAVAMVIAESALTAQDAGEFVDIEYEPLKPVTDARDALKPGAPQIWPDAPGNLAVDWPGPAADPDANAAEVERIFASAKHVARIAEMNQRLVVASMEPRGATASYDAGKRLLSDAHLLAGRRRHARKYHGDHEFAEGAHPRHYRRCRRRLRPENLGLSRIYRAPGRREEARPAGALDVGTLGSVPDRQPGARHLFSEAELALDENGKFLALRIRSVANLGAYIGAVGANIPTFNFTRCLPGMYDIRHIDVATKCVYTNTIPTAPYRGAGRPEANYVLERVVDEAARVTGIDPVKLRRRNLIKKSAMPYKTAVGTTIDSGDFAPMLDKALELADYENFKRRRRDAQKRGKYRGLGISCMLEHAGGSPVETAMLAFRRRQAFAQPQRAEHRPGPCHGVSGRDRRAARHCRSRKSRIATAIPRTSCPAMPRSVRARP